MLMSYTSLRFPDAQRIRAFETNEDSIRGTLVTWKTKKPHGLDWPWEFPRMGMAGANGWGRPLIDFRDARAKKNGFEPTFTSPRIDRMWELENAEPESYSATRRKLALVCGNRGGGGGGNAVNRALYIPLKTSALLRITRWILALEN